MMFFFLLCVWLEDVLVSGIFLCIFKKEKKRGGLAKSLRTTVLSHVSQLWFKPLKTT